MALHRRTLIVSAFGPSGDLFFINGLEEQKFRVGALMIDVLDKFMRVVPTKSRQEGDVASGMIECLNKMGKKPEKIIQTMKAH